MLAIAWEQHTRAYRPADALGHIPLAALDEHSERILRFSLRQRLHVVKQAFGRGGGDERESYLLLIRPSVRGGTPGSSD